MFPTGIKVIGGVKEQTGEEFGVYVKRILPGGLASSDGEYFLRVVTELLECKVEDSIAGNSRIGDKEQSLFR